MFRLDNQNSHSRSQSPAGHSLADSRLGSVRNWTTVTYDNDLLIVLMNAWYLLEYKLHHFLDWDIFLDDMASGRTSFCSKLLVNAILASGSFQSPLVKDRNKPFADNIATLFYKEARRLWELEEGQNDLPRLQAAMCLYMVLGKHGRDKVGHCFLVEACRIASEIGLFSILPSTSVQKPYGVPEEKWERARAVTAWTLFNFQLAVSFTFSLPSIIRSQPPLQVPYDDESEALFRYECGRYIIVMNYVNVLVDPNDVNSEVPPKPEQIEVLYLQLKSWWKSRPECLNPTIFPSLENLVVAMQYHVFITRLFHPFLDPKSSLERVKIYHSRARSCFFASIKELRRLIVLHEVHHSWSHTFPAILDPLVVTGFGSLHEIGLEDRSVFSLEHSEPYQNLLTCFYALNTMSSCLFVAQPLYRLLTQACEKLNIRLPLGVTSTIGYYRSEEWTKNAANLVRSQYIADVRKVAKDSESLRMDVVVSQWDALTLGSNKSPSSSDIEPGV